MQQNDIQETGTHEEEMTYRDRIATIDEEGKRNWIYPKKQDGPFFRARTRLSWALLAFLFGAPFIKVGGDPLLLFNIIERKFIIFGVKFWPQDFHLFVLIMIAAIVFIFLFTAVFGRLFCGWICPQTVFMEMLFRKIEWAIEGNASQQRALNAAPWTPGKFAKKSFKHTVFYTIAFFIGNTFLAYLIGIDQLLTIVTDDPANHLGGLTTMIIFSGVFYFVFAWFREQACTLVCPYGRLQSVLLDPNSIVISYDFVRGEPREKFRKTASREGRGDCIDCRQCVAVCPTGIDIRNGTQLECVNCTACIDACDEVMTKVGLPPKLIKYASYNNISTGARKILTPRVIGYSAVLTLLIGVIIFLLASRGQIETTILRAPGTMFELKADGTISNLYTVKVVNKTSDQLPVTLKLLQPQGVLVMVGNAMTVPSEGLAQAAFFIDIPKEHVPHAKIPVRIGVFAGERQLESVETTFMGPGQ
jgi:cytochrome c oxidase accessory protein FixG